METELETGIVMNLSQFMADLSEIWKRNFPDDWRLQLSTEIEGFGGFTVSVKAWYWGENPEETPDIEEVLALSKKWADEFLFTVESERGDFNYKVNDEYILKPESKVVFVFWGQCNTIK